VDVELAVSQAVERESRALVERVENLLISQAQRKDALLLQRLDSMADEDQVHHADKLLSDLNRLTSLESKIQAKWKHLAAEDGSQSHAQNLPQGSPLAASSPPLAVTSADEPRDSRSRKACLSKQVEMDILHNRKEFMRHRGMVEASLAGSGMMQYQVIESVADILFQKYIGEVSLQVIQSCDSLSEAIFQTL
jgi:hypothetical protein